MLGADLGTVHNGMATVKLKRVVQIVQTLLRLVITRILNPSVCLHQNRGSQILVGVPPVTGARSGTAGTQNTFVHAIQLGTILDGLQMFLIGVLLLVGLQPGLNGTVLFVKVGHVRDQVFDDVHVWEWINLGCFGSIFLINIGQTSQCIGTVNVHGTGAANSFATGTAKGQGRVLFILDFQQSVQHHGSTFVQINREGAQVGRLIVFRIVTVDLKVLDAFLLSGGRSGTTGLQGGTTGGKATNPSSCCLQYRSVGLLSLHRRTGN